MLEVRHVSFAYDPDHPVLSDVSLTVAPGERVVLDWPNGSGKTTLAHIICGSLMPGEGEVRIDGNAPSSNGLVGYVRQDPESQLVCALVEDEIAFGPCNQLLKPEEVRARVDEALALCGIASLRERLTYELSGGQQQLVALAGVLAMRPRYMVLDEAFSMLDVAYRERLESVVERLLCEGVGVLQIAHPCPRPAGPFHSSGRHSLELRGVSVSYGKSPVLEGFDFRADSGLTLLCGQSGAGKSTCARLLAGVMEPTDGEVLLDDRAVEAGQVGLCFQRPGDQLFAATVLEDLMYGPLMQGLGEEEAHERAVEAAARTGLSSEFFDRSPFELSGGQARRAAIAGIVACEPQAYVFDEPTAGLDAEGTGEFALLVSALTEADAPVVLVTHEPELWDAPAVELESVQVVAGERTEKGDAGVELAALLVATVATFAAHTSLGAGLVVAGLLVALFVTRTSLKEIARALKPAVLLFALVLVGNGIVLIGDAGLSAAGLARGAVAVARIAAVVAFVVAAGKTLRPDEVAGVLSAPVARAGHPEAATAVNVALRFLPLTMDEIDRIRCAQRARGARLDEGGPIERLRSWSQVLVPLMVGLFRRGDELAQAMRERGYTGMQTRLTERMGVRDWVVLLAVLAWAAAAAML